MIATDCNSMRRDMTSSLRACLAAESWKRLWPDGKPTVNDGSHAQKVGDAKKALTAFEKHALTHYKVNAAYAGQALAILNHSPELLEETLAG
jgi:hypothetical protein